MEVPEGDCLIEWLKSETLNAATDSLNLRVKLRQKGYTLGGLIASPEKEI
jgi:hypothetical protein